MPPFQPINPSTHLTLQRGIAIPAHPLALTARRKLDERRQRALTRYYIAAGVGGLAVGVHTTQFAIRDPKIGLFKPVLALAAEEMSRADKSRREPLVRIAGICGKTKQAAAEAELIRSLGYHAGLLSLAALKNSTEKELIAHCRAIARIIPLVGFYLQPAAGGRLLPHSFWRRFAEIENVVAIKIAPFNRYQTIDVIRAIAESGRNDIALYTGNDDNIVLDLITPFRFRVGNKMVERRIVGGLLGHWAVWTKRAVEMLARCHNFSGSARAPRAVTDASSVTLRNSREAREYTREGACAPQQLLRLAVEVTDCNAAFFDAANNYAGCIAGIHEVLRRQGLLAGTWCLEPRETLSHGQAAEITRVHRAYPHLHDDDFVAEHLDEWLR
jgi:dihydrodipicolinate synthase/N-acetylneuraminate lyase